mmetsp:Transcript_20230/g.41677  ORF Transcript_20230/g.41677 Transcript_20230/m.41677 type:complete len:218 (+) Transcript_20230:1469-2122(+)
MEDRVSNALEHIRKPRTKLCNHGIKSYNNKILIDIFRILKTTRIIPFIFISTIHFLIDESIGSNLTFLESTIYLPRECLWLFHSSSCRLPFGRQVAIMPRKATVSMAASAEKINSVSFNPLLSFPPHFPKIPSRIERYTAKTSTPPQSNTWRHRFLRAPLIAIPDGTGRSEDGIVAASVVIVVSTIAFHETNGQIHKIKGTINPIQNPEAQFGSRRA